MPAQLAVMLIKTAHPIGRQGKSRIIGLSRLLDGRRGDPRDLNLCLANGGGFSADPLIARPLCTAGQGICLRQLCPGLYCPQPSALQVERIPPQANALSHHQDHGQGQDAAEDRGPGSKGPHAG
jgi:hypothetical protein